MLENFEGDVLLSDSNDGGVINIVNGLVIGDRSFSTAAYISLFGGNKRDNGRVDNNKTWWGNRFAETPDNEKIVSRFQAIVKSLPMTAKNIKLAESAAVEDLAWMIKENIADEIESLIKDIDGHRIELNIVIKKSGELIERGNWTVEWEAAVNGI